MATVKPVRAKRQPPRATPVAVQARPFVLPAIMQRALQRVISRQLRVHLGECVAILLAVLPALWLAQALADAAFNLPRTARVSLLIADGAVAVYLLKVYAFDAWRRRLSLPNAALLVERKIPGFRSSLISAVELSRDPQPSGLVRLLIQRSTARLGRENVAAQVVDTRRLWRWVRWALASAALAVGAFYAFAPGSHLLLSRLLLDRTPFPTRTTVVNVSGDATIMPGSDVTLSCRAQGVVPRSGRLRLTQAGGGSDTFQAAPTADDPAVFTVTFKNVQQGFTCHFELNDGVGEPFRVSVQVPPALVSCEFVQTYPAYTGRPPTRMSAGNLSLMAGSRVQVKGRATQALQSAALQTEGNKPGSSVLTVAGGDRQAFGGEFVVPKEGLTGFSIPLKNAAGVASQQNTVYSVDFVVDNPPTVELTLPAAERSTVTLTARPTLRFSARDDYRLSKVAVRFEVERPTEAGAEPTKDAGEIRLPAPPKTAAFTSEYVWNLSAQQPAFAVGSTVWFWIEVTDNNDITGPGVGRSERRSLVILSAEDKRAELRERLGTSTTGIEELYQNQRKANEDLDTTIRQIPR